jgi:hypothetical protein
MIAAGALIFAKSTKRFLFLMRNNTKSKGTWGLPGGKINFDENIIDGLYRELNEELGSYPEILKIIPLEKFTSMDQEFSYYSYVCLIDNEFIPILNSEHSGYAWADIENSPKPIHSGLFQTINLDVIKKKISFIKES